MPRPDGPLALATAALFVMAGALCYLLLFELPAEPAPTPAPIVVEAPPPPPAPKWTVLSREAGPRVVGSTVIFEACISYISPLGERQRCEMLAAQGGGTSAYGKAAGECWDTARIGDPLPECWR